MFLCFWESQNQFFALVCGRLFLCNHHWKCLQQYLYGVQISVTVNIYEIIQALLEIGATSLKQIGMFTFTGLNSDQVAFMRQEFHIYMTSDG